MKVLARRVKSDGRVLNLGVVDLSNGSALGSVEGRDFVRPIVGEKRTVQTCNKVEPLFTITSNGSPEFPFVDFLLYECGQKNFATVDG